MGNDHRLDGLIIGQGLAGTCLAFEFLRRKKSFKVIDVGAGFPSSTVAAGTFNPVSFRTHSLVWMAEILVPYLLRFYRDMETFLEGSYITERPIYRRFRNEDQRKAWKESLQKNPEMTAFMESEYLHEITGVNSGFGFGVVKNAGTIHLPELLGDFRNYLKRHDLLIESNYRDAEVEKSESGIRYQGLKAERLLLCQGHAFELDEGFTRQPFRKTKGEVLIIEAPELEESGIIHDGINIVPLGRQRFWAGSTFRWNDESLEPTAEVRSELEETLENILNVPWKVVDHRAGIRPTVIDRRPVIGRLPGKPEVVVFNGMGTRGVMLAPFFSMHLANHLFEGSDLQKEVNIERFTRKG